VGAILNEDQKQAIFDKWRMPEGGWPDLMIDEAAYAARKAALAHRHPFQSVLRGLTQESIALSEAGEFRLSARDFGNGHKECAVWLHKPAMQDMQDILKRAIDRDLRPQTVRGEGDVAENAVRNVRRAKQKVRHLCKSMAVNSLWTLTIKENMQDREQMLKYVDRFRRRVVAVLGEWKYVACIEPQERGALHVHLATHALPVRLARGGVKVKSWDVMRAVWRSVLKVDGLSGNFDEAKKRKRWGGSKPIRGAGAIASYIAGYVAKDMQASQLNRKRYSVTKGIEIPEAVRASFAADEHLSELIVLAYAAVGDRITRAWFCKESMVFYVESDDSMPPS
jgi:hypothetical protein